jgi:hypothetical protein
LKKLATGFAATRKQTSPTIRHLVQKRQHSRQHSPQRLARTSTFRNLPVIAAAISPLKAVGCIDRSLPSSALTGSCMCTRTTLVLLRSDTIPQVSKREVHMTFTSALTGTTLCGHAASNLTLIACATRLRNNTYTLTARACCSVSVWHEARSESQA